MAKRPQELSEEEILQKTQEKSQKSVGWYDSRLSRERGRVIRHYNGSLPARQHDGSSSYVSTDVYDAVELAKAQILEVFSGSDEIAQFDPDQDMTAEDCRVATEYARYVIFRENLATTTIFPSVIHDGLTARAGIVKAYWEEKHTYSDEEFSGLAEHEAMGHASQEDVDEFDAEQQPDGTYNGTLTRKTDCSCIRIDVIAPEEFLIEKAAVSLRTANYSGHRTQKTKAELKEMGYDAKLVDAITSDETRALEMSDEVLARNQQLESGSQDNHNDAIQDDLQPVTYYESYIRLVIDRSKGARLYKICHAGDKLLDKQEVDKVPFIAYVPLPVPHVFYGNNFAARVIPVQNARTVLTRAVLDHATITTNPRWAVVNGGLLNAKEMLENRLGGIVNVRRPDSVTALAYPNLNPFVFEVLGMLKEDKEQSTGISALSAGLNKDAISKQNSQGLVGDLVSLSGQRGKLAARQFAAFLTELMIEVVRLAIVNQKKAKVIEVAGKPMQITPQAWTERTSCSVSMHLGYGEKDAAAGAIMVAYDRMAQDPAISTMFTAQNRYNMITDALKLKNMPGVRYITSPDKVEEPKPDPLKVQEVKAKTDTAQAALIAAQTGAKREQDKTQIDVGKLNQKNHDTMLKALDHDRTNDRQDLETASRVNTQQREIDLAEHTAHREAFIAPGN